MFAGTAILFSIVYVVYNERNQVHFVVFLFFEINETNTMKLILQDMKMHLLHLFRFVIVTRVVTNLNNFSVVSGFEEIILGVSYSWESGRIHKLFVHIWCVCLV